MSVHATVFPEPGEMPTGYIHPNGHAAVLSLTPRQDSAHIQFSSPMDADQQADYLHRLSTLARRLAYELRPPKADPRAEVAQRVADLRAMKGSTP